MINLEVITDKPPMSWDDFCAETPPESIALDGFVAEGPRFDSAGPRINFNHHEGVSRLDTRATCAQVLMAIRQGLFECFPHPTVYVNDCDEDVCTSWFLLKHKHLTQHTINPLVNRLVHMEDMLDATAGAYPFPAGLPALRELAWVFDPYRRARTSGELDRRDAKSYSSIIEDVEHRILKHVTGTGGSVELDTRYERIGGGTGWTMVREIGPQARTGMFGDGIKAYVAVRDRPDGRHTYTIGRMSQFIRFDISKLLEKLNEVEGCSTDRWGGGDTIGGSPRVTGSRLKPEEVQDVVQDVVQAVVQAVVQ